MTEEMPSPNSFTRLLLDWSDGDEGARNEMLPLVYDELRRLAALYLLRERRDHTLQPTALVHEAYLRLIDQRQVNWKNRAQFVGLAAVMMRRILVNHARDRAAEKRGGDMQKVPLSDVDEPRTPQDVDVIVLHEAFDQLGAIDPRKSRIVELKFFGGLTCPYQKLHPHRVEPPMVCFDGRQHATPEPAAPGSPCQWDAEAPCGARRPG